ncbi:hypothetical protein [Okeania sp. KiyG1]|nr:hypothetical protein [Okeania sp. KiyG1]
MSKHLHSNGLSNLNSGNISYIAVFGDYGCLIYLLDNSGVTRLKWCIG